MPVRVELSGTVRYDQPVAQLDFMDGLGEHLLLDLSVTTAVDLMTQLAMFIRQVGVNR